MGGRLADAPAAGAYEQPRVGGRARGVGRVVPRRDHQAASLGAGMEERQHVVAVPRVEVIRRLVEQADRRVLREQRRDVEPAPFAAGQGIDRALGERIEPDGRERGARRRDVRVVLPLPERQVGVTADQRGLEHRGRERVLGQLRQQGEALRALAVAPRVDVAVIEQHAAGRRAAQARERMQRQRLAYAVPSQHGDELATDGRELEALDEPSTGDLDVDAAAGERRRSVRAQGCRRSWRHGSAWKRPSPPGTMPRVQRARSCRRCSPSHQSSTTDAHKR